MKMLIPSVFAVATIAAFFVSAGECPVAIPLGWHTVTLTSYYAHPSIVQPPPLAEDTTMEVMLGPGIAEATSHRFPIGHAWTIDGVPAKACDETTIFSDGFEIGTAIWSLTKGVQDD